jgi:hypothetical protein
MKTLAQTGKMERNPIKDITTNTRTDTIAPTMSTNIGIITSIRAMTTLNTQTMENGRKKIIRRKSGSNLR